MGKVFGFIDSTRQSYWEARERETLALIDTRTGKVFEHLTHRVDCPVCRTDDAVPVFDKEGFDFVKCRHCGLLYVNPQLRPDLVDQVYEQTNTATAWISLQQGQKELEWNARNKYRPALEALAALRPAGGRLLDVGCSTGQFMTMSLEFGWSPQGVELNLDAARIAREDQGLTVHTRKLEDLDFQKGEFDLITLWGVIEHLSDPNEMLARVRGLLAHNGLLLCFVPNGHSLIIRLSREHNSTVSGPFHIWYFTPRTLENILNANGFRKREEFSILPQIHEIIHFLQYNTLYREPEMACEEELDLTPGDRAWLEDFITRRKLGYKLITIAEKRPDAR
ncbi:MAG: class I SAM-dependent methyltransferase [Proteobacteria bacterium]|nr:class I SAM-dependent methyltransferase [Pseudomonadota bacterium]